MSDLATPSGQWRRATEDDPEHRAGPPLLLRLCGVLRGMRLYDGTNQALRDQLDELMKLISSVMEDEVTLVGLGDYFYLNGVRLKADAAHVHLHRALMSEFEARGLGGLRFTSDVTRPELENFLRFFLAARDAVQGEQLADRALTAGILHIMPICVKDMGLQAPAAEEPEKAGAEGERQRARQTFWHALHGTRSLVARTAQTGRPALHLARRLVQPIVDSIMKDEYSIIGLTAMKDHDEYTYAHSVNVSVLSISMGQVIGFPRQVLANLGVAGLLHDIGKLAVPSEVLQKPGLLTAREWTSVRHHPLSGARIISRLPSFSMLTLDAMRTAFQHHMNLDQSGYPQVPEGSRQTAFPRIVAVADFFDAVTSHRAYRKRAFTGFEALHSMIGKDRKAFDPGAVWALVKTVGLYPPGSVLLTASGYVVLSISPNRGDLLRPHSRVLLRPDSSAPDQESPEIWDPMPSDEQVVRVLDPEEVPVETTGLLAA